LIGKGHERTFWNDANVLYLILGSGYMGIYIYKKLLIHKFNICTFPACKPVSMKGKRNSRGIKKLM
jgi:hypothetical protein